MFWTTEYGAYLQVVDTEDLVPLNTDYIPQINAPLNTHINHPGNNQVNDRNMYMCFFAFFMEDIYRSHLK